MRFESGQLLRMSGKSVIMASSKSLPSSGNEHSVAEAWTLTGVKNECEKTLQSSKEGVLFLRILDWAWFEFRIQQGPHLWPLKYGDINEAAIQKLFDCGVSWQTKKCFCGFELCFFGVFNRILSFYQLQTVVVSPLRGRCRHGRLRVGNFSWLR